MRFIYKIISGLLSMVFLFSLICNPCFASEQMSEDVLELAVQEVQNLLAPELEYMIRKCYSIELPVNRCEVVTDILNEYEGFEQIYLVEVGYRHIASIVQSHYVCIGVNSEGVMHSIKTPMELLTRIYDVNAFDSLKIDEIFVNDEWKGM